MTFEEMQQAFPVGSRVHVNGNPTMVWVVERHDRYGSDHPFLFVCYVSFTDPEWHPDGKRNCDEVFPERCTLVTE